MTRRRLGKLSLLEVFLCLPPEMTRLFFPWQFSVFFGPIHRKKYEFLRLLSPVFRVEITGKAFDGFSLLPNYFGGGGAENKPSEGEQKKVGEKNFFSPLDLQLQQRKKSLFRKKSLAASKG